ncbi:MAG: S1 family peptidase [Deltaproteobacteria bacterium]|nr:S1 family peptidase [Deltaproteobacteria bacterium]
MPLVRDKLAKLTLAASLAGCSPDADGLARRAAEIRAGEAHDGDPAVVALVKRRAHCREPWVESFCTGVLVAERVVLTAAHCAGEPALDLEVYAGVDPNGGTGRFFGVIDQRIHPGYDPETFANDLALLQLEEAPRATPVPVDTRDAPAVGDRVRVVGFGGEGSGGGGRKRQGTSEVTEVEARVFRTAAAPSLACGGDSGAPVFAGEQLVGVVRSGDPKCAEFANVTFLSPYLDEFVRPYLASPPAPSRRIAPLTENLCAERCIGDDDCPRGMLCLPERELGSVCGWALSRSGVIGAPCTDDAQCASELCASSGPGDLGRTCGCFVSCRDLAQAPPSAGPSTIRAQGGGCGWARAAPPGGALTATLVLGLCRARRRRRRRSGSGSGSSAA